jgi:hypothetical protein
MSKKKYNQVAVKLFQAHIKPSEYTIYGSGLAHLA